VGVFIHFREKRILRDREVFKLLFYGVFLRILDIEIKKEGSISEIEEFAELAYHRGGHSPSAEVVGEEEDKVHI